jgi:cytoskeletal protein CcmA (bactofilin family)
VSKVTDERVSTSLGKETSFSGTMRFEKSLRIEGRFQGKIVSQGGLYIEQGAEIDADIEVGSAVIAGTVRGNVFARDKVELLGTARLYGDVRTTKLKIADGVVFEGKCEMIKEAAPIDIFAARSAELKETLKGA